MLVRKDKEIRKSITDLPNTGWRRENYRGMNSMKPHFVLRANAPVFLWFIAVVDGRRHRSYRRHCRCRGKESRKKNPRDFNSDSAACNIYSNLFHRREPNGFVRALRDGENRSCTPPCKFEISAQRREGKKNLATIFR